MWLLLYVTKEGKEIEAFLGGINKGNYDLCENTIKLEVIKKLKAAMKKKEDIKYVELENTTEEVKAKQRFGLSSLPALIHIDTEKHEVLEAHYKKDIFLEDFSITDF